MTQVYDPGYGGHKPGVPILRTACASASLVLWCEAEIPYNLLSVVAGLDG